MKVLPPANWLSAPASRTIGSNQLSPIEVGPGCTLFFATHVPAIEPNQNPILVKHPIKAIESGLLFIDFFENNGRLPW